MAANSRITSPQVNGLMQTTESCPFCGARQGSTQDTRYLETEKRSKGRTWYFVCCWMCGAKGASDETVEGAVKNWNSRPSYQWRPLAASSFLLPQTSQGFSHVLVHDDGRKLSFVDYLDDDIQKQTDVDLGVYRLCTTRHVSAVKKEEERARAREGGDGGS